MRCNHCTFNGSLCCLWGLLRTLSGRLSHLYIALLTGICSLGLRAL